MNIGKTFLSFKGSKIWFGKGWSAREANRKLKDKFAFVTTVK